MSYGDILDTTRELLLRRAQQSGVPAEELGLDGSVPESDDDTDWPDTAGFFQVSVIVSGALDEEFTIGPTMYEVNIADWIADELPRDCTWEIIVSEYSYEDAGAVHYIVRSGEVD